MIKQQSLLALYHPPNKFDGEQQMQNTISNTCHNALVKLFLVFLGLNLVVYSATARDNKAGLRLVPAEQLAIISTTEGDVYVELAPFFAPEHVKRFKSLSQQNIYNKTKFYRVIEGFVAQGGPADNESVNDIKPLALEGQFATEKLSYSIAQEQDLFAPFTGFSAGFAIGLNTEKTNAWLLHCPGVVAMARGNAPDTATTDFYITIGQAPRYLDRIMTVFGRVVYGMDAVQRIKRAPTETGGIFENTENASTIKYIVISSEIPVEERPFVYVEVTEGKTFEEKLHNRKHRSHAFFFERPPAVLDACQVPLRTLIENK